MQSSFLLRLGALVTTVAIGGAGCGSNDEANGSGGAKNGELGDGIPSDGSRTGNLAFGDSGTPAACANRCSADLRSVVDCNDKVLTSCPAGQGCGANGTCVDACQSARDNKSSIGCDYYAMNPDGFLFYRGSCFAAFIVNTWNEPVSIGLEYEGQSLNAAASAYIPKGSGDALTYAPLPGGTLPPNEMAIVFLANFVTGSGQRNLCPAGVVPAVTKKDVAIYGTGRGHAFHITTSAPTVAYDIYPYGGASSFIPSATLLLPTSVWDTNYLAVAGYAGVIPDNSQMWPAIQAVVAAEDNTRISIRPTGTIHGGTNVGGGAAGHPVEYTLNKGEVLQISQLEELTGSPIQSNKPIGVWGGHYCMQIPAGVSACDTAHQQIPPVKALGHEYAAVRHKDRAAQAESSPWRIVGAVDGTLLSYEPKAPPGAPTSLAKGQFAEFSTPDAFVVKSQGASHPFYISGHMSGRFNPGTGGTGDPEFVNVIPPAQFLSSYVFFADPTYAETSLVLTRTKSKDGSFKDVTLDCLGTVSGWEPLGTQGRYEFARVDLQHLRKPVGGCDNGRHAMQSESPFGVTVWGFDIAASYAYPAGASVRAINDVVISAGLK
jgi:hypothetical protein